MLGTWDSTSLGRHILSPPTCTFSSSCSEPALASCSWFSVCSWGPTKLRKTRKPSLFLSHKNHFREGSYPRLEIYISLPENFSTSRNSSPRNAYKPHVKSHFSPLRKSYQLPSYFYWMLLGCPWKYGTVCIKAVINNQTCSMALIYILFIVYTFFRFPLSKLYVLTPCHLEQKV